jgi:hypothetical protein
MWRGRQVDDLDSTSSHFVAKRTRSEKGDRRVDPFLLEVSEAPEERSLRAGSYTGTLNEEDRQVATTSHFTNPIRAMRR